MPKLWTITFLAKAENVMIWDEMTPVVKAVLILQFSIIFWYCWRGREEQGELLCGLKTFVLIEDQDTS